MVACHILLKNLINLCGRVCHKLVKGTKFGKSSVFVIGKGELFVLRIPYQKAFSAILIRIG